MDDLEKLLEDSYIIESNLSLLKRIGENYNNKEVSIGVNLSSGHFYAFPSDKEPYINVKINTEKSSTKVWSYNFEDSDLEKRAENNIRRSFENLIRYIKKRDFKNGK